MSTQYEVTQILLGELILQANQFEARGKERALQQLNAKLQKAAGMSGDEVIKMLQKSYGYIEKAAEAKTDPPEGKLTKLPLADALRDVNVELVEANSVSGLLLRCYFCHTMWRVEGGYKGGDVMRPSSRTFWKCPQGCNASATFKWDGGEAPSYNAMSGYR